MKIKYLLPHKFIYVGLAFTILTLTVNVIYWGDQPVIKAPVLAIWTTEVYHKTDLKAQRTHSYEKDVFFRIRESEDIYNELIGIGLLLGLSLMAFAREKVEDEYTQKLRLDSIHWSLVISIILFIFGWLFVYGSPFLLIYLYIFYIFLGLFALRFRWVIFRSKRKAAYEE